MKKYSTILIITGNLVAFAALSVGIWNAYRMPRLAYVRSQKVVEGYMGMKEALNIYKDKVNHWQAGIDTLNNSFNVSFASYKENYQKLSETERKSREEKLEKQRTEVLQYKQSLEEKAKEENEKLTQGALNQINSYIERYARERGYQLVLGVTLSGNILYAENAIDISEEVLKGLNEEYKK